MLVVVLLFMIATVAVPTVQSILKAGASALPFDLARVTGAAYAISLLGSLALLFVSLALIYARVPNRPVRWAAVWPGRWGDDRDRRGRPCVPALSVEHLHDRAVRTTTVFILLMSVVYVSRW